MAVSRTKSVAAKCMPFAMRLNTEVCFSLSAISSVDAQQLAPSSHSLLGCFCSDEQQAVVSGTLLQQSDLAFGCFVLGVNVVDCNLSRLNPFLELALLLAKTNLAGLSFTVLGSVVD